MQESDQILAIDGQVLDSGISHQEAISILQKASGQVELIVARGAIPRPGGLTDLGGITPPQQQVRFIYSTSYGPFTKSVSVAAK